MHGRYAARLAAVAIGLGLIGVAAPANASVYVTGEIVAAAQGPVVTLSPDVAEPGDSVQIDTDGCGLDNFATASSPAFESSVDLKPVEEDFRLIGVAKIDQAADPGQYTVSVECAEGATIEGQLRVVPPSGPNTGGGGLASTVGIGQNLAGTTANRTGVARGTGGLPAGQGAALVAMLVLGALTGAVAGLQAHRRNPGPS